MQKSINIEETQLPKTTLEEAFKLIPTLFEINLNTDKDGNTIFRKLSNLVYFDEGFIYYLNPESLQLKYTYKKHANYKLDETFPMSAKLKKELFTPDGGIYNADSELIKTIGLSELKKKTYIVGKICIKSTVFGIVLLASQTPIRTEKRFRDLRPVARWLPSVLSIVTRV